MIGTVLTALLSLASSWLVAAWVLRHAHSLGLVQSPNHRSSHVHPTPGGGGLGIVVASSLAGLAVSISSPTLHVALSAIIVVALPIAAVGWLDDRRHVPIRTRLSVQLASLLAISILLTPDTGIPLLSVLALLVGIWWVNLFNFMDGIDGIAGAQAVSMLLAAALLSAWTSPVAEADPVWLFMICTAAATTGFLILNWPPARIFMGDVGSTWLGFTLFAAALYSLQAGWLDATTWLILAAPFVSDASVTLLVRMMRGERWHEAHRSHAYQILSRRPGFARAEAHRRVTVGLMALHGFWLWPLAAASHTLPAWSLVWLALAYLPLLLGAWRVGAGRAE